MLKVKRSTLILLGGAVWLTVGFMLAQMGARYLNDAVALPTPFVMWTHPLLEMISSFKLSRDEAALLITAVALLIGFFKARFVLSKTANKNIQYLNSLPDPSPVHHLFNKRYVALILSMMLLGALVRLTAVPYDIRALIYLAVGFALLQGSIQFFTYGRARPAKE